VQPLDLSLSLYLYLVLTAIDPRSQLARWFAPVQFHLPIFLLSAAQSSVPGYHQTNLLGQPRFSFRPMAETVSAHNRAHQPRTAFPCSRNTPACPINPRVTLASQHCPHALLPNTVPYHCALLSHACAPPGSAATPRVSCRSSATPHAGPLVPPFLHRPASPTFSRSATASVCPSPYHARQL
jgi:hypothetical protein